MKKTIILSIIAVFLLTPYIQSKPKYFVEGGAGYYKINGETVFYPVTSNQNILWKDPTGNSNYIQTPINGTSWGWTDDPQLQFNISYGMYITKNLIFKTTFKLTYDILPSSIYEGTRYQSTGYLPSDDDQGGLIQGSEYENRYENTSINFKDYSVAVFHYLVGVNQFFSNQTYFLMDAGIIRVETENKNFKNNLCFNAGIGFLLPLHNEFSIVGELSYLYADVNVVNSKDQVVEKVNLGGPSIAAKIRYNIF